jgi:hypothetical protein
MVCLNVTINSKPGPLNLPKPGATITISYRLSDHRVYKHENNLLELRGNLLKMPLN